MTRIHLKLINISVTFGKRQGVLMNALAILYYPIMDNTSGKASQKRQDFSQCVKIDGESEGGRQQQRNRRWSSKGPFGATGRPHPGWLFVESWEVIKDDTLTPLLKFSQQMRSRWSSVMIKNVKWLHSLSIYNMQCCFIHHFTPN